LHETRCQEEFEAEMILFTQTASEVFPEGNTAFVDYFVGQWTTLGDHQQGYMHRWRAFDTPRGYPKTIMGWKAHTRHSNEFTCSGKR
jgi:hypothetical protein